MSSSFLNPFGKKLAPAFASKEKIQRRMATADKLAQQNGKSLIFS